MSERYARQMVLPQVGATGQERLARSRVLIVGAGGLGCPVLQYLAAAGAGRIVLVDHDRVEESNLHRQPLYRMEQLGQPKVLAARDALRAANPEVHIEPRPERLTPANAAALLEEADIAVDAADSFAVTYVLSDVCQRAGKPLVSASVLGLTGYVGAFCASAPSYRAVFPEMPRQAGSCAQSGVLGTAVGIVGTLQAHYVLALLLALEPSVLGRITTLDLATLRFDGFDFRDAPAPQSTALPFIAPGQIESTDLVVDLRSRSEAPTSPVPTALRLSVDEIEAGTAAVPEAERVVLCCRTGLRAWRAARALERRGSRSLALLAMGD